MLRQKLIAQAKLNMTAHVVCQNLVEDFALAINILFKNLNSRLAALFILQPVFLLQQVCFLL